jgi:GNAT superfamily N-acetyltransferase
MQRTTVEDVQITLGPLGLKDRVKGIKLVARTFAHLGPEKQIVRALFLTDESLSLALRRKGELVGVYLVRKNNHQTPYDGFTRPDYDGSKGLKVESLAILPSLRGQGYGRLLRAALPAMAQRRGFDFVWGAALTALDNKQDWLRRRVLEDETEHGFVTVEPLNEAMKKRVAPKATPELLARWNRMKRASNGTLQGRLVIETTAEKERIPWLIADDGAYCGDPLNEEEFRSVEQLQGTPVSVSGRVRAETFAGPIVSIVPPPDETMTEEPTATFAPT